MKELRALHVQQGRCRCGKEKDNPNFHLCADCRAAALAQSKKHGVKIASRNQKKLVYLRKVVFEEYGNQCACCGEANQVFLTIDHINNDGREQRKRNTASCGGQAFYRWIIKNGFPDDLRLLCYNCNCVKNPRGGRVEFCPHNAEIESTAWFGCA